MSESNSVLFIANDKYILIYYSQYSKLFFGYYIKSADLIPLKYGLNITSKYIYNEIKNEKDIEIKFRYSIRTSTKKKRIINNLIQGITNYDLSEFNIKRILQLIQN